MSAVDALRQNDPAMTGIIIRLRDEPSDADLAQALEQNPFITTMDLFLCDARELGWNSLFQVIATRANLEKMFVRDADDFEERNAPAALVSAILRAIQQNSAVETILLLFLCLPTDLSIFVDTASSITVLGLYYCDMEPSLEREEGARDLAAALQRNTNIQTLRFDFIDEPYFISSILHGLQSNISVKTLDLCGASFSGPTRQTIQHLLESTASIQTVLLRSPSSGDNGDTLCTIAQSLIRSTIVCGLEFRHSRFEDEAVAAQFRNILQNKQNLTGLCFNHCDFSGGPVHADITSALLRADSPLRSFELTRHSFGDAPPSSQFQNLLRAVETSKLERFVIGDIEHHEEFRTLTESIPGMHVKELQVVIASELQNVSKQLLLQAVRNNFSLRSVAGRHFGRDLFDDNDKTRLVFYATRNKLLDQWVDNSETVGRKVWPDALKLAGKAGPDSLFRGLRSVLGGDYVKLRTGRKRQRPQYYAPS